MFQDNIPILMPHAGEQIDLEQDVAAIENMPESDDEIEFDTLVGRVIKNDLMYFKKNNKRK